MPRYLCQVCNGIVSYGENHSCFFYKNEENVSSIARLEESVKKNKKHEEAKDISTENSNENSAKLCSNVQENNSRRSEQLQSLLTENNDDVSYMSVSRGILKYTTEEASENGQLLNPRDTSFWGSISNIQVKEDHSKENASLENFGTVYRPESDSRGAFKRNAFAAGSVYEQNKSGSDVSNLFLKTSSDECEISLEESKWQSLNYDKKVFFDSLECASQTALLDNKNLSGATNYHVNSDFLSVIKEPDNDMIGASEDLKGENISPAVPAKFHNNSKEMAVNVDDTIHSMKDDNAVAGPYGMRPSRIIFTSDVSPKQFQWKSLCDEQYRTHSGHKPYVCNMCGEEFAQKENFIRHYRTHTGDKPFVCNVCKKGFAQNGCLKRHIRIHTGEKPYKCPDCGMAFTNGSHCNRHRKNIHK